MKFQSQTCVLQILGLNKNLNKGEKKKKGKIHLNARSLFNLTPTVPTSIVFNSCVWLLPH